MSAILQRVETVAFGTPCFGSESTDSGGGTTCTTNLLFDNETQWSIDEFRITRSVNLGPIGSCPPFYAGPGIYNGGVYPNTVSTTSNIRTVAAAVDCATIGPSQALRFGFNHTLGGPCGVDAQTGNYLCCPGGTAADNYLFFDHYGYGLPANAIVKDVFCPSSFQYISTSPSPSPAPSQ